MLSVCLVCVCVPRVWVGLVFGCLLLCALWFVCVFIVCVLRAYCVLVVSLVVVCVVWVFRLGCLWYGEWSRLQVVVVGFELEVC